jgi:hypothetical protein
VNEADLSWPEDPGYDLRNKPLPPGTDPEDAYVIAQAQLAFAGARRERYGRVPGRDPEVCEQLNADVTEAQAQCDAAREALIPNPEPQ